MRKNKSKYNKYNIINSLIGIGKKIHDCYDKLVIIEVYYDVEDRADEVKEIYSIIRKYRELEDIMFSKLTKFCIDNNEINDIYDYLFDIYKIKEDTNFLFYYIDNYDRNIEVLRLLEKVYSIESDEEMEEDNSKENIGGLQVVLLNKTSNQNVDDKVESIDDNISNLMFLLNEEDVLLFMDKIDAYLALFSDNQAEDNLLIKEQLIRAKYDMIFLTNSLETMMFEDDYSLYPSSFVNAKEIAARELNMNDEEIDIEYDSIRKEEILRMAENLSQRKSNNDSSIKQLLKYIIIDVWADTIPDWVLADVISELYVKVNNSYNDNIFQARTNIYNKLFQTYKNRISKFIPEESNDKGEKEKVMAKKS